jgi:hypothetical protein
MFRFQYLNLTQLSLCVGLMLTQIQISAHAESILANQIESTVNEVATAEDQKATQSPSSIPSKEVLAENQVPKLTLRWDCGTCVHNEKVIPLIEANYTNIAAAKGYSVSGSEAAEIVITVYRQRNPAARAMFGIFAGKDVLATRITFRGKDSFADDYSANAITGMNSLCATVSQKAFNQIIASIQMQ